MESKNPKLVRTKNRKIMLSSKCEVCDSKNSKFIKWKEAIGLLSSSGINRPLNKIPLLGPLLFQGYKMNETVNKFLLAGDYFMPEMHLRQPGFTYRTCGPFTKNKDRIKKFKETEDSRYIYQNELDKACFQHEMAYGDFKDLNRRTFADKILCDYAFNMATNPKCDGYQRGLASMVYNFFDKKNFW